jgi:hypothetical protein
VRRGQVKTNRKASGQALLKNSGSRSTHLKAHGLKRLEHFVLSSHVGQTITLQQRDSRSEKKMASMTIFTIPLRIKFVTEYITFFDLLLDQAVCFIVLVVHWCGAPLIARENLSRLQYAVDLRVYVYEVDIGGEAGVKRYE